MSIVFSCHRVGHACAMIALACIITFTAGAANAAGRLDATTFKPATLKDLLKARDLQFDNLTFRFLKRETKSKVIGTEFGESLPPPGEQVTAEVTTEYRVTIRGAETTIDVSESVAGGIDLGFILQHTRTSNASGRELVRQVIPRLEGQPDEVLVTHSGAQPPNGLLDQDRMFAEFCLGIGYGRRIVDITSIEQAGDDLKVQATIKMFDGSDEVSQGTLVIDHDFLVRDARLQTRDESDGLLSEIKTFGILEGSPPGKAVASSATHKRRIFWTDRSGSRRSSVQLDAPFNTLSIKYDLTPAEYSNLSQIEIDKADRVVDMTPKPEVGMPAKVVPRSGHNSNWSLIVIVNALILALLGLAMLKRRLSAPKGESPTK